MDAFGKPGLAPTWCSSAKDVVSTGPGGGRVWFSLGRGILNEVYWPATGRPQVRDLGFIVAGQDGFWAEVKRENRYRVTTPEAAIPLPLVVHEHPRYRLELEVLADPDRDVILVRYDLGGDEGLRLYPLVAPHLGGRGTDNTAWVERRGVFARRGAESMALVADEGVLRASAGFVGASDGWSDFHLHGAMTWSFDRAAEGNVALMAELPAPRGVLALAFAPGPEGAFTLAASALAAGWEATRARFVGGWAAWSRGLAIPRADAALESCARLSATVLRVHEDRTYPGAVVASLSVPWGNHHDDAGGYHLVWPRDAVEAGLALLGVGQTEDAQRMLAYLASRQSDDGSWAQNFYPDGHRFWTGVQLDETALPILLAAKLKQGGWPPELGRAAGRMVARAATFLARTGPSSPEDRWEENAGFNPFTLSVTVAALVAAASLGFLDDRDRDYALSLADDWNARIEEWTYVEDTELDRRYGLRGHYVRLTPPGQTALRGRVQVKNHPDESLCARTLVGMEFLYLARLGLRAPDDPRIADTLRLVDAVLRVETPTGAFYRRYNDDGYGEHADGAPFDGTGIGRLWPLLAGERGQHAVLLKEDPTPYLRAMMNAGGPGGLIPEQVWDAAPIPERFLEPGKATGSAMPLVWAHAELLKLLVARERGRPIEWLDEVAQRYQTARTPATCHWRDDAPFDVLPQGRALLIEDRAPFTLRHGTNGWQAVGDRESQPVGLGMHGVRFEAGALAGRASLEFTRLRGTEWERRNHQLELEP